MTHQRRKIAVGLGLTKLVIGGVAISLLSSLWVPWHLVPAGKIKLAWTQSVFATLAPSAPLPPELRHVAQAAWRGVYQQQRTLAGSSRTLLVLPRFRYQRATPAILAAAGWQVRRLGPYIHATDDDHLSRLVTPRVAARAIATTFVTSRWPLYPASILEVAPSVSGITTPLAAVATQSGDTWRVVVDQSLAAPAIRQTRNSQEQPSPADQPAMVVGAPGSLWGNMPETLWDELLHPGLHFTRTQPPIERMLATLPHATVVLATADPDGSMAIVVEDPTGQFALAATTWLQEEERRGRLVNRAFRLPDGALAYEKIPGEALPVLSSPDEVGCRGPLPERTTLWLCQQGARTALATDHALALYALTHVSAAPLTIEISPMGMRSLQQNCPTPDDIVSQVLCRVRAIKWQGSEAFHIGEVIFSDQ